MIPDIDAFMDAEVGDDDKTYIKYHIYCIVRILDELVE